MTNLHHEIIAELSNLIDLSNISFEAWSELKAYYPEKYKGVKPKSLSGRPDVYMSAWADYICIVESYLRIEKIPVLIETLLGGLLWGVDRLKDQGLAKAPTEVKSIIGTISVNLQPQYQQLINKAGF